MWMRFHTDQLGFITQLVCHCQEHHMIDLLVPILTQGGQTTGRRGKGKKKWKMDPVDEWGWGVSSTITASCPENYIHHFHIYVSRLTLAIGRNVAMMTLRIDEVQAGVASRGLGWRWSNQMWLKVDWDGLWGKDLMKVTVLPSAPFYQDTTADIHSKV